jgi:hypothetical protein
LGSHPHTFPQAEILQFVRFLPNIANLDHIVLDLFGIGLVLRLGDLGALDVAVLGEVHLVGHRCLVEGDLLGLDGATLPEFLLVLLLLLGLVLIDMGGVDPPVLRVVVLHHVVVFCLLGCWMRFWSLSHPFMPGNGHVVVIGLASRLDGLFCRPPVLAECPHPVLAESCSCPGSVAFCPGRVSCSCPGRILCSCPGRVSCSCPGRVSCSCPGRVSCSGPGRVSCSCPGRVSCSCPGRVLCSCPGRVSCSSPGRVLCSRPG